MQTVNQGGGRPWAAGGCVAGAPAINEEGMARLERGYTVEGGGDIEEIVDVAGGMRTIDGVSLAKMRGVLWGLVHDKEM